MFAVPYKRFVLADVVERSRFRRTTKVAVRFPDGSLRKPSLSTLKRKLATFREQGADALARKPRSDRGRPRKNCTELIAEAIEIKRDQPRRSHRAINLLLKKKFGRALPKSTLYRHLKKAGATRLKLGVTSKKVRKPWTKDHTHALWVGDFEHGPYVLYHGRVVSIRLSVFIDCHSAQHGSLALLTGHTGVGKSFHVRLTEGSTITIRSSA